MPGRIDMNDYLHAKADVHRIPIEGTFELTSRCTMHCRMCYIHTPQGDLDCIRREKTGAQWLEVARQMRDRGTLYLMLTGGEPLLHKDFKEIYLGLKEMGFIVTIKTNATLITPSLIEWFARNPPSEVSVTIYGASNETYEKMCGFPGGYARVTEAVRLLKAAKIPTRIYVTVTKQNVEEYEKIDDFAKEQNLSIWFPKYVFPPVRRESNYLLEDSFRLSPVEMNDFYVRTYSRKFGVERHDMLMEKNYARVIQAPEKDYFKKMGKQIACRAGLSSFWITWEGIMTACSMTFGVQAHPFEEGFTAAWEKVSEGRKDIIFPEECVHCHKRCICPTCPAIHYSENGDYTIVSQYLCDLTNQYFEEIEKNHIKNHFSD